MVSAAGSANASRTLAAFARLPYRAQMLRVLRQSLAIASIVACMLSVVLWMRSQVWQDTIYYVPSHMSRVHRIDTMVGRVIVAFGGWTSPVFESGLAIHGVRHDPDHLGADFMPGFFGLSLMRRAGSLLISLPYWFSTFFTAALALLLNSKRMRQFGLRQLFLVITLVAATLGLGIVATKSTTQFEWLIW